MTSTQTITRTGFTQVNLLPPENKERQETARKTRLVALIGAAVVAALVFFSFIQSSHASQLQTQVGEQNATNATAQAEVAQLQPYAALRQGLLQAQQLHATAMAGDVSWSNVLHQLSTVVPSDVWLNSITGTATPTTDTSTVPTTGTTSPVIGSLTFQCESLGTDGIVSWLRALVGVPGWANAWVSSAQQTAIGNTNVWQCSSSVDLTNSALTPVGTP